MPMRNISSSELPSEPMWPGCLSTAFCCSSASKSPHQKARVAAVVIGDSSALQAGAEAVAAQNSNTVEIHFI
jgi:hypothetical protein